MDQQIIVIDDEDAFLRSVKRVLISCGYQNATFVNHPAQAISLFEKGNLYDLALIDVTMPDMDGISLLKKIKSLSPDTECIMVTAVNEAKIAAECMRKGAYDYLTKPVTREDLMLPVKNALERKRFLDILNLGKKEGDYELKNEEAFSSIKTISDNVIKILKEAEIHAVSDVPILITGESGTGKELLANAIFKASKRANFPFTAINMASLTGTLFDAEFFGHTKGAFTGAEKDRKGYLEHTNGGTLFLDEIGLIPLELQGKLLRVLEEGEYIKIGTNEPRKTDIRIIASTNENLDQLMKKGLFRKDLFYRLKGAWLHMPPLRERREDIPLLADQFLREFGSGSNPLKIKNDAMKILYHHAYPGNIRELKSIIQSAANLAKSRDINSGCLPDHLDRVNTQLSHEKIDGFSGAVMPLAEAEKNYILQVYEKTGRNKSKTARVLKIALNTLRNKLASYGVD